MTLSVDAGTAGLGAWTVDLTYDAQAVRLVSCEPVAGSLCNATFAAGSVRITGASGSGLIGSQALARLTFEGLRSNRDQSSLTVTPVTLTDVAGTALVAVH